MILIEHISFLVNVFEYNASSDRKKPVKYYIYHSNLKLLSSFYSFFKTLSCFNFFYRVSYVLEIV